MPSTRPHLKQQPSTHGAASQQAPAAGQEKRRPLSQGGAQATGRTDAGEPSRGGKVGQEEGESVASSLHRGSRGLLWAQHQEGSVGRALACAAASQAQSVGAGPAPSRPCDLQQVTSPWAPEKGIGAATGCCAQCPWYSAYKRLAHTHSQCAPSQAGTPPRARSLK